MLDPFAQLSPTLLGPRKRITHGLQSLTGCILPTIYCRSQHYWELLRPFAHHCQHGRNNFQHCWELEVVASVYTSPLVIEQQILARLYQRCLTSCHLRLVHTRQQFAATRCGDTSQRQISVVEIFVKIFVSTIEFCRRNKSHKIKSD